MTAQVSEIISSVSRETREELMRQVVEINASPDTEYASDLVLTIPETDGSNGTLKVAMECAYAPYNWTQTTDANGAVPIANAGSALYANGYDVIFAKYIAATLLRFTHTNGIHSSPRFSRVQLTPSPQV